jgi:hypothetical protein
MRSLLLLALVALPAAAQSTRVQAALSALFPEAKRFTAKDVFLTEEVATKIQAQARTRIHERMVTFYVAAGAAGDTLGYVVVHTHQVRTKNETLAIGLEPDGSIRRIDVALFLEPAEYEPPPKWLAQFKGKTASARLAVGDDLDVISGASLSARSVTETARWLLRVFPEAGLGTKEKAP